eukprot:CAMPEP_0195298630 /NCGR_PEP_ID=MMETSP0707-20130614/23912_1 /TAXON_ID=33640 /ORGANISM="Asterionellopsis glacialis, Strain CCMP134" /LENGTH=109 /DNA_ID=CAMNT_0040360811 /DNA_START=1 /DNA_END=326 /DNA_ORIENTATION=+
MVSEVPETKDVVVDDGTIGAVATSDAENDLSVFAEEPVVSKVPTIKDAVTDDATTRAVATSDAENDLSIYTEEAKGLETVGEEDVESVKTADIEYPSDAEEHAETSAVG